MEKIIEALAKQGDGNFRSHDNGSTVFIIKDENPNQQWNFIKEDEDVSMRQAIIEIYQSFYHPGTINGTHLSIILTDSEKNRTIIAQTFFDQKNMVDTLFFNEENIEMRY